MRSRELRTVYVEREYADASPDELDKRVGLAVKALLSSETVTEPGIEDGTATFPEHTATSTGWGPSDGPKSAAVR